MIVPFTPAHLSLMDLAPEFEGFDPKPMADLLDRATGLTMMLDDGPVYCAGVLPLGDDRFLATAAFSRAAGQHMKAIVRNTRLFLDTFEYNRVEAISGCDAVAAHKFLRATGFECEAPRMRKFSGGRDYALFARVK